VEGTASSDSWFRCCEVAIFTDWFAVWFAAKFFV